jgi:hypothetical protein
VYRSRRAIQRPVHILKVNAPWAEMERAGVAIEAMNVNSTLAFGPADK